MFWSIPLISAPGYRVLQGPRPPYRGTYINLDKSTERRAGIEGQLASFGFLDRYTRFPAISTADIVSKSAALRPEEVACFHSHCSALSQAKNGSSCLHIMEDDIVLSKHLRTALEGEDRKGAFDKFDIVFTETFVGYNAYTLRQFKSLIESLSSGNSQPAFTTADVSSCYMAGMTSYLVPPSAIERVLSAFKRELEAGPSLPVDILVRKEASEGRLRLGCIFPFVTTIDLADLLDSTIRSSEAEAKKLSQLAAGLLRYSFFIDRDLERYAKPWRQILNKATGKDAADPHHAVLTEALSFVLSSSFTSF
jgi:GR25 family glycosyltransferase involved in LPS biosynthesis